MFNLTRTEQTVIVAIIIVVLSIIGGAFLINKRNQDARTTEIKTAGDVDTENAERPRIFTVHMSGEVHRPGIYHLPAQSRVYMAVQKAGPKPSADLEKINLAAFIQDAQKIHVPAIAAPYPQRPINITSAPPTSRRTTPTGGKININTASSQKLETLPGIGPGLAGRIIQYRTKRKFLSINDIQDVPGIGPKRYAAIKNMITVR